VARVAEMYGRVWSSLRTPQRPAGVGGGDPRRV